MTQAVKPPSEQGIAPRRAYADIRRRIVAAATLFAVALSTFGVLGFMRLRENAYAQAQQRAQTQAQVLSAHLERVVVAIDAMLVQVALQSPRLGGPTGASERWLSVLDAARSGSPVIGSLSVTDTRGVIRQSTLPALVGAERQDRFAIRALADPNGPALLSDAPFRSPLSGLWFLPFARRLSDDDGRVAGAIVATFAPGRLRDFYHRLDTEGGRVRVLHESGVLVLEEPTADPGAETGAALGDDPVFAAHRLRAAGPLRTTVGTRHLITSYAPVADTALIVEVSLDENQALRSWRADAWAAGSILVGALAALGLAVSYILRQLRARERAEIALRAQQQQLVAAQRLESIGQLTGGVAHDFNNLLTVVINNAESLKGRIAAELEPRVDGILRAADNGAALIRQLLAYSRRQPLVFSTVDLNATVRDLEDLIKRTLGASVETAFSLAPDLWLAYADRAQVESALLNLTINARDAMPTGGKLTVETHNAQLDADYAAQNADIVPGDYVALAVSDTGQGMAGDVLERALEPFFTTKAEGKGSGLGLSMVYGFAKQSKGHLKIYSEVGRGTTVRLYLPRPAADVGVAIQTPAPDALAQAAGDMVILIAEDDAQIREVAVSHLRGAGFTVLEAGNAAEALAILATDQRVDLLFTDIMMPGERSGLDLAREARVRRPHLGVLYTSGYADASVMRNGWLTAGDRFLSKPYRNADLAALLHAMLGR